MGLPSRKIPQYILPPAFKNETLQEMQGKAMRLQGCRCVRGHSSEHHLCVSCCHRNNSHRKQTHAPHDQEREVGDAAGTMLLPHQRAQCATVSKPQRLHKIGH